MPLLPRYASLLRIGEGPRETQLHLVTLGGGRPETSEHWSFFCVEKSFWAGGLAPHRGHGYALEEYAIRRRRRKPHQRFVYKTHQNDQTFFRSMFGAKVSK